MKFSVAQEQLSYFKEHGAIEFEGLLNESEVALLRELLINAVRHRLKNVSADSIKMFMAGRDLWRANEDIIKLISQRRFGELASQLIDTRPLRLGFDQYFPEAQKNTSLISRDDYEQVLQQNWTLQNFGSIQGVLCGLMICLSGKSEKALDKSEIFSSIAGNGVFFVPSLHLNLVDLYQHVGQDYYLVVYTSSKSVYILNREDRHTRDWIDLGYTHGDKLSDKYHPILYK